MSFSFQSKADTGKIVSGHNHEKNGVPKGGYASCGNLSAGNMDFHIRWQDGPLDREAKEEPNGAFVEDVLEVCKRRLAFYQESMFACPENGEAIEHIQKAIEALEFRRTRRKAEGKQGEDEEQPDQPAEE